MPDSGRAAVTPLHFNSHVEIPIMIGGELGENAFKTIAEQAYRSRPGKIMTWNQKIGKSGEERDFKVVFYPRGFPVPEDYKKERITKIERDQKSKAKTIWRYNSEVGYNFQPYLDCPLISAFLPIPQVEDQVRVQKSYTGQDHYFRFTTLPKEKERTRFYREQALTGIENWNHAIMLVYNEQNEAVAFALSHETDTSTRAFALDVHTDYREQGIGLALLQNIGEIARLQGTRYLNALILRENKAMTNLIFKNLQSNIQEGNLSWGEITKKYNGGEIEVLLDLQRARHEQ